MVVVPVSIFTCDFSGKNHATVQGRRIFLEIMKVSAAISIAVFLSEMMLKVCINYLGNLQGRIVYISMDICAL